MLVQVRQVLILSFTITGQGVTLVLKGLNLDLEL